MYKIKEIPKDFIVNEIPNLKLEKEGLYSIFLLEKEDLTTQLAIELVARNLKIRQKEIGYAGNKDKKAITSQYISIKNIKPQDLELNKLKLTFKGKSFKPISIGALEGNEFIINVITEKQPKNITKIINYFGEQRFSTNNKNIGKLITKKDFKGAVELIIKDDQEKSKKILPYLEKRKNDYIGALRLIPPKILKLYIHSYQSYLWNKLAKKESNSKENKNLPVVGFGTNPSKEILDLLKEENIKIRDFIIRQVPELTAEGTFRELYTEIKDLITKKTEKGYNLKFKLKKGSYATEVIRQLFL
jgi:tRNA pseudouridine13 synthase|tara:strand:+ start:646 stop:1551 length:906 start_codon:yes stop_codon:yes gene_type:complete